MFYAVIVGQGIAGSCLALELLARGKKIIIIDDDWKGAACRVAAGVLNPITGKRLVKSWRSDVALPYAKKFFEELQKGLGTDFYKERKILQLCKSQEESELWEMRKGDPCYREFLSDKFPPKSFAPLNDNFGSFLINFAAWVEAPAVMAALRKHFLEKGILRLEKFDHSSIAFENESLKYNILKAERIIFCEGWRAIDNKYFNWLPYRLAKGEIISVHADRNLGEHIIHREKWLMKHKDNIYRSGSTWEREDFRNENPTPSAKDELMRALPSIAGNETSFRLFAHEAGVRPCTITTRPHIGRHPEFERLYSFNGFGSKGYALSPYFAAHFCDWLEGKTQLDREADVARHVKRFYNK